MVLSRRPCSLPSAALTTEERKWQLEFAAARDWRISSVVVSAGRLISDHGLALSLHSSSIIDGQHRMLPLTPMGGWQRPPWRGRSKGTGDGSPFCNVATSDMMPGASPHL
jgi:hypothetical protein